MKFSIEKDWASARILFKGEVLDADIIALDLDPLDKALLNDTGDTAADHLLVLEMLFRRYQEQVARQSIG